MSPAERQRWIEREDDMPLTMQCELAGVPRSSVYRRLRAVARQPCLDEEDRLRAAALGVTHYVVKPMEWSGFSDILKAALVPALPIVSTGAVSSDPT